jgi:glycosyltransferase involved in cell wall biosynthesis
MKVLLVNSYSMEKAYNLWGNGTSGSHHVWGKVELDRRKNVEMVLFLHEKYKFLNKLGNLIGISHLDQQIRVLGNLKNFDVLYAPYSLTNTKLLVLLKFIGIFRKPIVVTIHQPFLFARSRQRWKRLLSRKVLLQFDSSIFLSKPLMDDTVNALEIPQKTKDEKFSTANWGPDLQFYKKFNIGIPLEECTYVISAGHTDRDYETIIEAFRSIDFKLKIFCTKDSIPTTKNLPTNVEISTEFIPYIQLLEHYVHARMILIPLKYPKEKEGCQGMTGIQDVIAFNKPAVMTRNPFLNLDIESEGFGVFVEKEDITGWVNAINGLLHDFDKLRLMQKAAEHVFQTKMNTEIFASSLENVLLKSKIN